MNMKFKKYFVAFAFMSSLSIAPISNAGDMPNLPSPSYEQVSTLLQTIGAQPSGTIKENDKTWCIFNEWESRDQRANAEGRYDTGRFSTGTMFGGRWYCTMKK